MMEIDGKADFLSAISGVNLSYSDNYNARASVNIEGNGIPLMTTSSIIINLDTYIFGTREIVRIEVASNKEVQNLLSLH